VNLYTVTDAGAWAEGDWRRRAMAAFRENMTNRDNPFPCVPATQAFALGHLRYAFAGDPRLTSSAEAIAPAFAEFGEGARSFGKYATLIAIYETPPEVARMDVPTFERLFWRQLNALAALDGSPWPEALPDAPDDPAWEFCFGGESYFMYCATPAHVRRRSRSFPYFMLAITPRWVLTKFTDAGERAKRMRTAIHDRLLRYDDAPRHPELKTYGSEDNYEWKQYFLRDDDSAAERCPFLRNIKK